MPERPARREHTRLIVGFGFLTVFSMMLLVAWLSVATLQSVNEDMSALVRETTRKIDRAFRMRDAIRLRTADVRSLAQLTDPDERERALARLVEHTASYDRARQELGSFGANAREQAIVDQTRLVDDRVAAAYDRVNEKLFSIAPDPDGLRRDLGELQLQELVLLNHLNSLVELERTLAEEALAASQATFRDTRTVLIAILATAFALSSLVTALVVRGVARANRRIAHLAAHDDLTGLYNRRSFEEHLVRTLALARRGECGAFGVLYLDLDHFKAVNDTCGHHAGDELLIGLTGAMGERLRGGDVFARVGGDEFAIIAGGERFEDIRTLAEDLRSLVESYVFEYDEQVFRVSLSVGLVPLDERTEDIEGLLAEVDSACYVAKQSGRNHVHVATENDQEVVRYRSDIDGVRSIRQALAEERLSLFFQPVFDIEPQGVSMSHCEVLLRIRSENGEVYSPERFIPIAEKYNIMSEIDRWVFSSVVDWLAAHEPSYHVPRLLMNLSGLSFVDDSFRDFVVERLERGDIDPANIVFEITEAAAADNPERAHDFVERVRGLGCRFALDDFGSGFSTFAYLKRMSVDYLKIDGSLVESLAVDEIDREMVSSINEIGHTVGARTIAEFVEDDETLSILREMGVDYAQGYGLRLPSPLARLVDELDTRASPDAPRHVA